MMFVYMYYSVFWNLICIRSAKKCLNPLYISLILLVLLVSLEKKLSSFWLSLSFIRQPLLYLDAKKSVNVLFCDKCLKEIEISIKSELTGLNN